MKYIIANWKLYFNYQQSIEYMTELARHYPKQIDGFEIVICPSNLALSAVSDARGTFKLGAQNCFWETHGAYTGEISVHDLKHIGCSYVLIGHSERRLHLGETDEMVNKKIITAFRAGLDVVLCIGETDIEHKNNITDQRIQDQLSSALVGVTIPNQRKLLIAYEPVWAIYPSTIVVDPGEVELRAQFIQHCVSSLIDQEHVLESTKVLYGGSVDQLTVMSFCSLPSLSGMLVGHASTELSEFDRIIQSVI